MNRLTNFSFYYRIKPKLTFKQKFIIALIGIVFTIVLALIGFIIFFLIKVLYIRIFALLVVIVFLVSGLYLFLDNGLDSMVFKVKRMNRNYLYKDKKVVFLKEVRVINRKVEVID